MAEGKYVAYYRVSTVQQGKSGLGLDAQQRAVRDYLNGGRWELCAEYTEVESGKRKDRPQLLKAINACKVFKASLVIAKIDRLSRNASFLLNLRDAGLDFVAVDMPAANRLTVGIMAMVAEDEAERISARTKAALRAKVERDGQWDRNASHHLVPGAGQRLAAAARARLAQDRAAELAPFVADLRALGIVTLRGIAVALGGRGIPGPSGAGWSPEAVRRLLIRIDGAALG